MRTALPRILMCAHPLDRGRPDPDFEDEAQAAAQAGFVVDLVSYEALALEGDARRAVARVSDTAPARETPAVYRGWMLSADDYVRFYDALAERGLRLVNTPAEYRAAHEFPEYYGAIRAQTARSEWIPVPPIPSIAEILRRLQSFGRSPLVLRDYVKSRKHEWNEACFIPDAGDADAVGRVVDRFVELQADDLYGGLVFREFLDLVPIGPHPLSGAPRFAEYRLFFLDGRLLFERPYWSRPEPAPGPPPEPGQFDDAARAVRNRFFTMDVARRQAGGWAIIEVGDGQVSGLPDPDDAGPFYRALARGWGA